MLYSITALRFFAAIAIYIHHLSYPGGIGVVFVTLFFVLSGFTIAYGYNNKFNKLNLMELKSFYLKRLARIYPLHILTFLLAIPIVYYSNFKTNIFSIVSNILLLQTYYPIGQQVFAFNGVSWFVGDLLLFYLLTPIVLYILNKMKVNEKASTLSIVQVVFIILGFSIAYMFRGKMLPYSFSWWFIYISPFFRAIDFITGILAGLLFLKLKDIRICNKLYERVVFTVFEVMSLGGLYYSYKSSYFNYDSIKYGIYYLPASIIILIIFAYQKGFISSLFSRKLFVGLGGLSYSIFMLHQIVISYTSIFYTSNIYGSFTSTKHLLSQIILFIVIIIISEVINRYYEKPLIDKLTHLR